MPKALKVSPMRLEDQCLQVYLNYLYDEMHLLFHLRNFQQRSVLMQGYNLAPDRLYELLQSQMCGILVGIVHEIVRQRMLDILISKMHSLVADSLDMLALCRPPPPLCSRNDYGCLQISCSDSQQQHHLQPQQVVQHHQQQLQQHLQQQQQQQRHLFLVQQAQPNNEVLQQQRPYFNNPLHLGGPHPGGGHQQHQQQHHHQQQQHLQHHHHHLHHHNHVHRQPNNDFMMEFGSYGTSPSRSGAGNGRRGLGEYQRGKVPGVGHYRSLPIFQLFELVLHPCLKVLDFSRNKEWLETDQMGDVARTLWKIVAEKCQRLERFVVPKELSYSSTLNGVVQNCGAHLTHLTLKRNVPNNMFLSLVGQSCPNLQELDIAGADIVTDFGTVCLLFADPEQIFLESWNREKTVGGGSGRRSNSSGSHHHHHQRSFFPHPHFDKPIPDPTDQQLSAIGGSKSGTSSGGSAGAGSSAGGAPFLYLKRTFHEVIRDPAFEWELLPVAGSLLKLRLENTKVKGDGASVVLECCPNLYSLGYLVFAAAGLKQVYGYEEEHETKFTEIFYRGPSDQKLQTISNCCKKLKTMFLGSNNVRRLNHFVFSKWRSLQYLTLENIIFDDVPGCLEAIGKQLLGLKIQCAGFDITDVAVFCPNLESLVVQKEVPFAGVNQAKVDKYGRTPSGIFANLKHLEVTCNAFPKVCFSFIVKHALNIRSIKVLSLLGLKREDIDSWFAAPVCSSSAGSTGSGNRCMANVDTLIFFLARELTFDMAETIIENLPSLRKFGDFNSFDIRRPNDLKKLYARIKEERWDLQLFDSQSVTNWEKDFSKLLTLHWFYLTDGVDVHTKKATTLSSYY